RRPAEPEDQPADRQGASPAACLREAVLADPSCLPPLQPRRSSHSVELVRARRAVVLDRRGPQAPTGRIAGRIGSDPKGAVMTCCPVPLLPDREPDQAAAPASSGRGLDAAF